MMEEWRRQFDDPDLPFLIVQLPGYGPVPTQPTAATWADLREAQRQAALADPHAAIAVTVDIGDPADLHPTNKREVGRRLAIAARHLIYGERIPPSGPVVAGVARRGPDVVVSFSDVTGALTMREAARADSSCAARLRRPAAGPTRASTARRSCSRTPATPRACATRGAARRCARCPTDRGCRRGRSRWRFARSCLKTQCRRQDPSE